jgi:NAD+ kinase
MPTVAIVSKPKHPLLPELVPQVSAWLQAHGYDIVADPQSASCGAACRVMDRDQLVTAKPGFAIVLGGDGTLLSAAQSMARAGVPILGVNLGSLGFMTEVALSELFSTLETVHAGQAMVESRTMLECQVVREDAVFVTHEALNDAVVGKGAIARTADFDVYLDKIFIANYKADGIIVATPTGSTAYSLAAGGPIVVPDVGALLITPVSPHALTNRPLVVRDTAEIELTAKHGHDELILTIDGQIMVPLKPEDRIVCRKSKQMVQLLRTRHRNFFEVLRTKLKWAER